MVEFVTQHQFCIAVVAYWLFSAAVSALPEPAANSGPGYLWLFRFVHTVAGNITTAFGSRIPGVKVLSLLLIAPLLLSTAACAAHYTVHPGALSKVDSETYDALLIAETVIDQARTDYQSGQLPASAKEALDTLILSYNVARGSWLTYRGAVATNLPSDVYFAQLTKNVSDLTTAIRNFTTRKEAQ